MPVGISTKNQHWQRTLVANQELSSENLDLQCSRSEAPTGL